MIRDDPKLPDDGEEVGNLIPGCEISSLLDGKFAKWSTASCALALACRPSVSQKLKIIYNINIQLHGCVTFYI
jgi:hypothetical protein